MSFPRASGVLLHPTSLPSRGGIGDFGPAAYSFADYLASAKQGLWQVLPMGPLGYGNSPYSSTSAFAGSPLLISLERLADRGYLDRKNVEALPQVVEAVDYQSIFKRKLPPVFEAAHNFLRSAPPNARERFERFREQNRWWLDDFVLFDGLRSHLGLESWNRWPRDLAHRDPAALQAKRTELRDDLETRSVVQFFFSEQWQALRTYCTQRSIRMVGDIAIFVNMDSADVWIDRLRWATHHFDYIRLDHFRGFAQFWEIPGGEKTAENGRWVDGPKDNLFNHLRDALGGLPFFAEDLGYITPDVHALRERLKIPGMAVLQFGFGDVGSHAHLPHTFKADKVVYTGTHDNDTILGWWKSSASEEERRYARSYLGQAEDGVNWAMIRCAVNSVASLSVVPLQDILGLSSEARMN